MEEEKCINSDIEITYLYKKASHDKKHLVVIFSGFAEDYSFLNVGKSFKCNVLWIKDDYEGMECYYLGKNGTFDFAYSVNNLIEDFLAKLCLEKNQCTLLGGSKGAFTSLFFGVTFQYPNIVASAPTLKIGDRMSRIRPDIAAFMMGDKPSASYDQLLLDAIHKDLNLNKNIYLLVSKDDGCYEDHQKDLIQELRIYKNTNLVLINSDLVFRHNRVTAYSVPLIAAFITSLIEGIPPTFGYVESGQKRREAYIDGLHDIVPVAELDQIRVDGDSLILKGSAFFSGIPMNEHSKYEKKLRLKKGDTCYEYELNTVSDRMFSVRYFGNEFVNYDYAGISSSLDNNIYLTNIGAGIYQLYAYIKLNDTREKEQAFFISSAIDSKFISGAFEYRIWNREGKVFLSKRRLLAGIDENKEIFELSVLETRDAKIFIRGTYAIAGVELENWGDAKYYLVLSDGLNDYSFRLGMENNVDINKNIAEGFGVYQKSCFATIKHQGINLSELPDSVYRIYVVLSYKGTLFRKKIDRELLKEKGLLVI